METKVALVDNVLFYCQSCRDLAENDLTCKKCIALVDESSYRNPPKPCAACQRRRATCPLQGAAAEKLRPLFKAKKYYSLCHFYNDEDEKTKDISFYTLGSIVDVQVTPGVSPDTIVHTFNVQIPELGPTVFAMPQDEFNFTEEHKELIICELFEPLQRPGPKGEKHEITLEFLMNRAKGEMQFDIVNNEAIAKWKALKKPASTESTESTESTLPPTQEATQEQPQDGYDHANSDDDDGVSVLEALPTKNKLKKRKIQAKSTEEPDAKKSRLV
jgi:hypothetical protein